MLGMAGADDALADFDVEAEFAKELAALPDNWLPDASEARHSCCSSSSALAGGINNRDISAWPAGSSAGQDHSGELLRPCMQQCFATTQTPDMCSKRKPHSAV
jgi:hypothetical protein